MREDGVWYSGLESWVDASEDLAEEVETHNWPTAYLLSEGQPFTLTLILTLTLTLTLTLL